MQTYLQPTLPRCSCNSNFPTSFVGRPPERQSCTNAWPVHSSAFSAFSDPPRPDHCKQHSKAHWRTSMLRAPIINVPFSSVVQISLIFLVTSRKPCKARSPSWTRSIEKAQLQLARIYPMSCLVTSMCCILPQQALLFITDLTAECWSSARAPRPSLFPCFHC